MLFSGLKNISGFPFSIVFFFLPHQVGHEEEVDLGDCTRKRITRAIKPLLFGNLEHDSRKQRESDFRLSTSLRISLPENLCGVG